uniref:Uncharacterized protein n=1 Tax=Ditylenchus dipsaci TaxID=166011 RepID=A0A915E272_9BILA
MNPLALKLPKSVDIKAIARELEVRRCLLLEKYKEEKTVLTKVDISTEEILEERQLQSLLMTEAKNKKLRDSTMESLAIMENWTMEDLIGTVRNELAYADKKVKPEHWPLKNVEDIAEEWKKYNSSSNLNYLVLLTIEMAKTLPLFHQLSYKSQKSLLRHMSLMCTTFTKTFVFPNGWIPAKMKTLFISDQIEDAK